MVLEALKTAWNNIEEPSSVGAIEIKSLIRQRSNTAVAQIKRAMRLKMIMAGISSAIALVITGIQLLPANEQPVVLEKYLSSMEVSVMFAVMGLVMLFIAATNLQAYRQIQQFERSARPLKESIKAVLSLIRRQIRLVIYSDVVFTPLIMGYVAYAQLFKNGTFELDRRVAFLLGIILAAGAFSYFYNRWSLRRKFGAAMTKLKNNITELENLSINE